MTQHEKDRILLKFLHKHLFNIFFEKNYPTELINKEDLKKEYFRTSVLINEITKGR